MKTRALPSLLLILVLGCIFVRGVFAQGAASAVPADLPADAVRYAVLLSGNRAGLQASWTTADGARHYHYEFNDRGRGPKQRTRMVVGPDGIPTQIDIGGNDYFKAPTDEHFTLSSDKAVWKSTSEQGERQLIGKAMYAAASPPPEGLAVLARALLAAPEGKLALLPEGEARIARVGELEVAAGGLKKRITQYEITGLDFMPTPVWLEADGGFFALSSGWFGVVREGWEAVLPAIEKAQDARRDARQAELAKQLARKASGALVIQHAALFDPETRSVRPGTTVVVNGNRIQAVGPDGKVAIPAGAEVIDATGKTLLPGLWDMHVHISGVDGVLHMAAGVTSVRDLANDTDQLLAMRKRMDSGEAIGPRVVMAGFLDGRGPYQGPTKVFADSEEEAHAAIETYAKLGYVQIKIYSSIKPELVPRLVELAHANGMRISGHIPAYMTAEQAVRMGMDEIQHANMLLLNFMPNVKDTRTPARFTAVAENGAGLDLSSERVQAFIRLLKERKIVVDPTLATFEGLFCGRPGSMDPAFAAVSDRLPPQVRRGFLTGGLPVPPGKDQQYCDGHRAMIRMVGELDKAGITIVPGTDTLPGFGLHRELELYVQAGIPAPEVLYIATLGSARVMKRDAELGSIAPGKLADLVLINGDPTKQISDIRRVTTVIKDGVIYQADALDRAIGVRPQADGGASGDASGDEALLTPEERKHLRNIRQLTPGGENAEAYFSADNRKLIFQAHAGEGKCDQIYIMDLKGDVERMVSTGDGKTTCSYFFPDGKRILYASTHGASPACPPPPDYSRGYVWRLYPEFEIYTAKPDGTDQKRLTNNPGYDAEATVSRDGKKIVFTSYRDGDLDIYTMDPNGKNVKRLTTELGYDGGPFFSPDGKKIVYRAYHPKTPAEVADYQELLKTGLLRPVRFEIFVMDADGSNKRQLTDNGAASFAPFFHPDGKRIIFASNQHEPRGRNFDLYMINLDGTGLERITTHPLFDSFPMFSSDGKMLVWASNRNQKQRGDTNIFIADWVD